MYEITVTIIHPEGLHLRPAALFVQKAASYQSDIRIRNVSRGTDYQNAKSAMGVLMLKVVQGETVAIRAEGIDANEALNSLRTLIENGFGLAS